MTPDGRWEMPRALQVAQWFDADASGYIAAVEEMLADLGPYLTSEDARDDDSAPPAGGVCQVP